MNIQEYIEFLKVQIYKISKVPKEFFNSVNKQ